MSLSDRSPDDDSSSYLKMADSTDVVGLSETLNLLAFQTSLDLKSQSSGKMTVVHDCLPSKLTATENTSVFAGNVVILDLV